MSLTLTVLYLWFTFNLMAAMLDFAKKAAPLGYLDLSSLKQLKKRLESSGKKQAEKFIRKTIAKHFLKKIRNCPSRYFT